MRTYLTVRGVIIFVFFLPLYPPCNNGKRIKNLSPRTRAERNDFQNAFNLLYRSILYSHFIIQYRCKNTGKPFEKNDNVPLFCRTVAKSGETEVKVKKKNEKTISAVRTSEGENRAERMRGKTEPGKFDLKCLSRTIRFCLILTVRAALLFSVVYPKYTIMCCGIYID